MVVRACSLIHTVKDKVHPPSAEIMFVFLHTNAMKQSLAGKGDRALFLFNS